MKVLTRYEVCIETNEPGVEPMTQEIEKAILRSLSSFQISAETGNVTARCVTAEYIRPAGLL
jgi:hypothetical protein